MKKTDPQKQNKKLKDHIVRQHHQLQMAIQVVEELMKDNLYAPKIQEILNNMDRSDILAAREKDLKTLEGIFNQDYNEEWNTIA